MFVNLEQRGRIKTQKKAKVVAAFWGTELIFISCRGNYSAQGWSEERDEFHASYCPLAMHSFFQIVLKQFIQLFISSVLVQFIQFFKSSWCKTAMQGIQEILPPKQQRPLPYLLSLVFFYDMQPQHFAESWNRSRLKILVNTTYTRTRLGRTFNPLRSR